MESNETDGVKRTSDAELVAEMRIALEKYAPRDRVSLKVGLLQSLCQQLGETSSAALDRILAFTAIYVNKKCGIVYKNDLRRLDLFAGEPEAQQFQFEAAIDGILNAIADELGISIHNLLFVYRKHIAYHNDTTDDMYGGDMFEALSLARLQKLVTVRIGSLSASVLRDRIEAYIYQNS